MIWPAMRATIVEIAFARKCRLALDSIARRYAGARHSMARAIAAPGHAPRLSNRLGNGISNPDEFDL
jgi:hypothetical protein